MRKQKGFSLLWAVIFLGLIGFLMTAGSRLMPTYIEDYKIGNCLKQVASQSLAGKSGDQIRQLIEKQLTVNSISGITPAKIEIVRGEGEVSIKLEYETRNHLIGNLDGVAMFNHSYVVKD